MTETSEGNGKTTPADGKRAGVYHFLDVCLCEVQRLGGSPTPREAQEMWGDIWLRERHHSTAIEGNVLAFTEVREFLRDGAPVDPARHSDYLEVQGYADAAQWAYTQAVEPDAWPADQLISLSEVRHLHHTAMS